MLKFLGWILETLKHSRGRQMRALSVSGDGPPPHLAFRDVSRQRFWCLTRFGLDIGLLFLLPGGHRKLILKQEKIC